MALPDPIQKFVETTNRGDREAFVAVFTDDANVNDWGRIVRRHEDSFLGQHGQYRSQRPFRDRQLEAGQPQHFRCCP